jgi:hypothetical protein
VAHYGDRLRYQPTFITHQPEVQGFAELVHQLTADGTRHST